MNREKQVTVRVGGTLYKMDPATGRALRKARRRAHATGDGRAVRDIAAVMILGQACGRIVKGS